MDYFVLLLILYKIGHGIAIAIKGSFFRQTIVVECISNPPTAHGELHKMTEKYACILTIWEQFTFNRRS